MGRRAITREIARWRANVLDLDIVVDDKRQAEQRASSERREAERELAAAVRHLGHLVNLHYTVSGHLAGELTAARG